MSVIYISIYGGVNMTSLFKFCIVASLVTAVVIIIISSIKTKRFFSCIFLSAAQGICALFAVNALGLVTGLHLPLNEYTLIASAIGSTPAVIGMIILEIIFL